MNSESVPTGHNHEQTVFGVVRIHEGAWYDPDKGGELNARCKYGNPNVLTPDIGTSQLA